MPYQAAGPYRCPHTGQPLTLQAETYTADGAVASGRLVASDGTAYPIRDGIVDFTANDALPDADAAARDLYEGRWDVYDKYLPLTFQTFDEDEQEVRRDMVDLLQLKPDMTVLEVGAGTGRDSALIADRLGAEGAFYVQDISASMLRVAQQRLAEARVPCEFGVANATRLPFADDTFDAVFQFGGVGEFSDISAFFREVARVTKPGGRVVAGDENMPVWLRDTAFAKMLTNTNPQYAAPLPLEHLPIEARNVHLRWIIGGVFYLLDFDIGEGEPPANFDFPIPGARGGTHRTRYYGQLEGVTPETKRLAYQARAKLGLSMHDWLERIVRAHAEAVLDDREHGDGDSEGDESR